MPTGRTSPTTIGHGRRVTPSRFYVPPVNPSWLKIVGVTKDSTGAPLGTCTVELFDTLTDMVVQWMVSDAAGNFAFDVIASQQFYIRAVSASGLLVGTTLNTLTGVQINA